MAKSRYVGKSGKVYLDPAGGASYTAITLARNIQMPLRKKASVDVSGMEDADAETRQGTGEARQFSFEIMWDDADTMDEALATLYGSGAVATWKIEVTDGTSTWAQSFSGWVKELNPQAFGGNDPVTLQVIGEVSGTISDAVT